MQVGDTPTTRYRVGLWEGLNGELHHVAPEEETEETKKDE